MTKKSSGLEMNLDLSTFWGCAHVLKKTKLVSVSEDSISTVHSFSLPVPEMKE